MTILFLSSTHQADGRRVAALEAASLAAAGFAVLHLCPSGRTPPPGVPTRGLRRRPGPLGRLAVLPRLLGAALRLRPRAIAYAGPAGPSCVLLPLPPQRERVGVRVGSLATVVWPRSARAAPAPSPNPLPRRGGGEDKSNRRATPVLAERFPAGPDRPARVLVRNLVPRPEAEALARAAGAHVALVLFAPGPANHEAALPHKLFEAMALGLPVVVAETCRPAAVLVRRTGCGLVVDAADPASVAAALEALAADPRLRAHLGAAGRRALTADYAWEDDAARLASLHRRLARPREEAPAHPARPSSGTRHPWPR